MCILQRKGLTGGSYLHERVPVCDGLAGVCQHLTPVVMTQVLSIVTHPAHTNDLVVTYAVKAARDSALLKPALLTFTATRLPFIYLADPFIQSDIQLGLSPLLCDPTVKSLCQLWDLNHQPSKGWEQPLTELQTPGCIVFILLPDTLREKQNGFSEHR